MHPVALGVAVDRRLDSLERGPFLDRRLHVGADVAGGLRTLGDLEWSAERFDDAPSLRPSDFVAAATTLRVEDGGTAPIEVSSGGKTRHRLSRRGNRTLNHAIHTAAVTQISHQTPGRVYYDKKLDEGKTNKEALRALKRRISNAVYRRLVADARRRSV